MPEPSRPEAIRRLLKQALRQNPAEKSGRKSGSRPVSKASELAGREIDRLGDRSAPVKEHARRKRRLIKGPVEFRGVRSDLRKSKD